MKQAAINVKEQNKTTVKIELEEELTIQTIETVDKELKSIFDNYTHFNFIIQNVYNLDISCLQLLLAFKKSADSEGKTVNFEFSLIEELETLIKDSGFSEYFSLESVAE